MTSIFVGPTMDYMSTSNTVDSQGTHSRHWEKLTERIYLFRDSCNVYAVAGPNGAVIVNAGTGAWIDRTDELPAKPLALCCTHHFRDHSAGAAVAADAGIQVFAPFWEREFFEDAEGLFQRRETYIIYDNIWDLYGPTRSVTNVKWLEDWDVVKAAGLRFEVIPTAGVSPGAVSLAVTVDSRRVVFCGEVIHSPGRIARIAPLQYDYNDLTGALNLIYSLGTIRRTGVDVLAPSLGPGLIERPDEAIDMLEKNLRTALGARSGYSGRLRQLQERMPLSKISESVYQAHHTEASTYFVISRTKEVMAIDFGYDMSYRNGSSYPYPRNRMSTLHSIDELEAITGRRKIDAVIVTHFHDDHVNGIPQLQRLFGTKCYAGENFAPILAHPDRFAFPCTWPVAIDVQPIPLDGTLEWNEFTFRVHPMSGHTRFSTVVEFEADGKRFAATGDQYFFLDFEHPGDGPCMHNHVYRNGAVLSSFHDSNRIMERIRPDFLLPGHGRAYQVPQTFYERIGEYADLYRSIHTDLMPLDAGDTHFEVDSRAAWLEPYRVHIPSSSGPSNSGKSRFPVEFTAHIRNPYPHRAVLTARVHGPDGWTGDPVLVTIGPRAEGEALIAVHPPAGVTCRRQPVTLEIRSETDLFGEVAEALVTIGHPVF